MSNVFTTVLMRECASFTLVILAILTLAGCSSHRSNAPYEIKVDGAGTIITNGMGGLPLNLSDKHLTWGSYSRRLKAEDTILIRSVTMDGTHVNSVIINNEPAVAVTNVR